MGDCPLPITVTFDSGHDTGFCEYGAGRVLLVVDGTAATDREVLDAVDDIGMLYAVIDRIRSHRDARTTRVED